jgi:hypothetical protein
MVDKLFSLTIIVVQYEQFCRARPPLFPLIYTVKEAMARSKAIKAQPITEVTTGEKVFVGICARGVPDWYARTGLPDLHKRTYFLPCVYGE